MYLDTILKMQAGREINDLVATRVMGYKIHEHGTHYLDNDGKKWTSIMCGDFEPSTDIRAAWLVFEQITKNKPAQNDPEPTIIQIWRGINNKWHIAEIWLHHDGDIQIWTVSAETAPLAICRAALMSITLMRENVL